MGLGKTVQSSCFLHHLSEDVGAPGPFLVVAPLSTLPNWQRELERWTSLSVVVFHGPKEARKILREYEWSSAQGRSGKHAELKFDVIVTTYEMCMCESALLSAVDWSVMIVDEAHRLKSRASKLSETLRAFRCGAKVLLTGTPLQNSTKELWALLNFIDGKRFGDGEAFLERFGALKKARRRTGRRVAPARSALA